MRIEAYNQVAGLYQTTKVNKAQGSGAVSSRDQVQISQAGRDFQVAKQAVAQSPDVRADKVAQLKAKIESGEYKIDPNDFAAKLMEKYNAYL